MLTQNEYLPIYRSLVNDLDRDFFIPSYRESVFLERGVGFFSLGSLILDIDGIMSFLENGGKIHLVCNPRLSEEDINVIIAGQKLDKDCITKTLLCTSYDSIGRFHTDEHRSMWIKNMKDIHIKYPELKLHTEIIIT